MGLSNALSICVRVCVFFLASIGGGGCGAVCQLQWQYSNVHAMRVLLKLRNLHPRPVIRGCNGYEAVLLKHRRVVCVLRASLWSSSSSSTPSASTSKAPDHALVPPGTNNTLPVKFDEQSKVEGAENQVIRII